MRCQEVVEGFPRSQSVGPFRSLFQKPGNDHQGLIKQHIQHYSGLELTVDTDILLGMSGIFRAYERLECPTYNYCGVPIRVTSRKSFDSKRWTMGFVDGLLWRHQRPCRRRIGFPSWSWAGWFGIVEWESEDLEEFKTTPSEIPPVDIWIKPGNGDEIEWERFCTDLALHDQSQSSDWHTKTTNLYVQAQFIQVQFEYLPDGPPESAKYLKDGPGFYFRYCSNPLSYCDLLLSKEVEVGGDFFERLRTESWDCMILSTYESFPTVLVLDRIGEAAERIGWMSLAGHKWPEQEAAMVQSLMENRPLKRMVLDPPHLPRTTRRIQLL